VCRPGTTICQTIDHVLLDTGSYGLRLLAPLDAALMLPVVRTPSGAAAGECAQFVSGFAWGALQQADVKIAGESAAGLSVQVIGVAPGGYASIPASCTATGANFGTVAALGANGVLGVGQFKQDCGDACANSAAPGAYYACSAASCVAASMPLTLQVSNPAASFAVDNNGVILSLPPVPIGGVTALSGTLIFGIGTQSNNGLGSATKFAADANGNFSTTYKGATMASSFLDSGSNGLYFNDGTLPKCRVSSGFYCPSSPLTLGAINTAANGGVSGNVSFTIESVDNLSQVITAASIGGTNGSGRRSSANNVFDWGLPFFFGRRVYVGFEASASASANGPYWAY
jgi:hypothetical protein